MALLHWRQQIQGGHSGERRRADKHRRQRDVPRVRPIRRPLFFVERLPGHGRTGYILCQGDKRQHVRDFEHESAYKFQRRRFWNYVCAQPLSRLLLVEQERRPRLGPHILVLSARNGTHAQRMAIRKGWI